MTTAARTITPGHDFRWLRRFWLAFAASLTLAAGALSAHGIATKSETSAGSALILGAFAVWLTIARFRIGKGHEARYVVLASVGLYVLMLALLPLVPELAVAIVPAVVIPVFVASPYLGPRELSRYSIAAWGASALYALVALATLREGVDRGVSSSGLIPTEDVLHAVQATLAEHTDRLDVALAAQLVGVLVVVAIILRLLYGYAMANRDVQHLALHDALTGLANRALFVDRLEHALERGQRYHTGTAIVFIDVDRFKAINDRHGHSYGDDALRHIARRIGEGTRTSDTAARVGGDEFAILLEDVRDSGDAETVAQRLRADLARPLGLADGDLKIQVSMGIALDRDGESTPETLLQSADDAMYESKRQGSGGLIVHRPTLTAASAERRSVKRAFRGVVERGELRLQFQPLVELPAAAELGGGSPPRPGSIVGVEALLRWEDPERGRQMPARFVSLAEETGDIVPIGRWVLQEALRHVAAWQGSTGDTELFVAVNVSERQIKSPAFADDVAQALGTARLSPASLLLEVNERVYGAGLSAPIEGLQHVRSQGVRLAIDGFGSGHSSLAALKDFAADLVKLDRALVANGAASRRGAALARTAVALGAALEVGVVAEGIETPEQLLLMTSLGCHLGQGFLFARPLDPDAVDTLLQAGALPWEALFAAERGHRDALLGVHAGSDPHLTQTQTTSANRV